MSPGAQSIDDILARFRNGQGVCLSKEYEVNGTKRRIDKIDVYLFPQALCKDNSNGLIIVAGKGQFIWDGTYRLTGFKLLGNGISPIQLAHDVAAIANSMLDRMTKLPNPADAPRAIEGPKQENH